MCSEITEITQPPIPSGERLVRPRHRPAGKRRRWKRWSVGAALVLVGLPLLLVVWGLIEPRVVLNENRVRAVIPHLPPTWRNQRVALVADLQIGMWLDNEGMVRRIVDRIREQRPAAVLIAGDFIYHPTEDDSHAEALAEFDAEDARETDEVIGRAVELLRPLTAARIPTYAVLGNHDYATEVEGALALPWVADRLTRRLEAIGIHVLRNDARALEAPPSGSIDVGALYVAGIGPHWPGRDDVERTLSRVPRGAARIVMMHNPETFRVIPAREAPLALAGHTHGGQIRLPFLPQWSWLDLAKTGNARADGWITDPSFGHAGNRLYVNTGIGFSELPIRINCPPELTWITLAAE